jgi:hypothetical protein
LVERGRAKKTRWVGGKIKEKRMTSGTYVVVVGMKEEYEGRWVRKKVV